METRDIKRNKKKLFELLENPKEEDLIKFKEIKQELLNEKIRMDILL